VVVTFFFSDERLAFSAFGGILFGYDTGVISGIKEIPAWLKQFGFATTDLARHPSGYMISSSTESLVVSILSAGTFFGALMAAPAAGEFHPFPHTTATYQPSFRLPRQEVGYHLRHPDLHRRYHSANCLCRNSPLRCRSCVRWSRCRSRLMLDPHVPIRMVRFLFPILTLSSSSFAVHQNGSAVLLSPLTNGPLPSVSCLLPSLTTAHKTGPTPHPTASPLHSSSLGLLSSPAACSSYLSRPVGSSSVVVMLTPPMLLAALLAFPPIALRLRPSLMRFVPTSRKRRLSAKAPMPTASSPPRTRSLSALSLVFSSRRGNNLLAVSILLYRILIQI